MMTVADIHNVTFEKAVRGYRPEDVDAFLTQVAQEFESLTRACDEAQQEKEAALAAIRREKEDMEKKIYILAEKIEEYRKDEDNLKTALLNAQRLGESVVNEAKQKAETIVSEAKTRAQHVEHQLKETVRTEEKRIAYMQAEVARFKTTLLGMYKQHIDALGQLPVEEHRAEHPQQRPEPAAPVAPAPAAAPAAPVAAQPAQETAVPDLIVVAENAPEKPAAPQQEIFAPQDTRTGMDFAAFAQPGTAPAPHEADSFENYQGISFDE